jgi:hypothetical protein
MPDSESSPGFIDTGLVSRLLLIRRGRHITQRRMQSPVVVGGHVIAQLGCDLVIMGQMNAVRGPGLAISHLRLFAKGVN